MTVLAWFYRLFLRCYFPSCERVEECPTLAEVRDQYCGPT